MATIKDVARDAGVSVATVSCCLSGSRPVKESTRRRIINSVEKLRYIPNSSARNLRAPLSNLVGIVLTNIDDLYHAEIFKGISSRLQEKGYTLSVTFSNNRPERERQIINNYISQNVRGLIIITCQPENTAFFQNRVLHFQIPAIFLERMPQNLDASFAGFQNEETCFSLTDQLLEKGYRHIALVCGPMRFSSENDCIVGCRRAFTQRGLSYDTLNICPTNLTREGAFRSVLEHVDCDKLQAVISSSELIHWGAMEALRNRGVSVPDQVLMITFSEESWSQSQRTPGILYTSRTAFYLGESAVEMLLQQIDKPDTRKQSLYLKDPVIDQELSVPQLPPSRPDIYFTHPDSASLKILLVDDLVTAHNVELVSQTFVRQYNCDLFFEYQPHKDMLSWIYSHTDELNSYDIFIYDVPWLNDLAQNLLLADITDFVTGENFHREHIFPENLDNCRYQNRYYGIPIVGGTQILFYRKDLFENNHFQNLYFQQTGYQLRPPRTWTEFNRTAAFFSKKYNPDSPTLWGTSLAGKTDEELAMELLIRLWSLGGKLWDSYSRPCLDAPENRRCFESILETLQYTDMELFTTSILDTIDDFATGKIAMLAACTEYAAQISQAVQDNSLGDVGYCMLPGRRPASVGWNLGVNPYCTKKDLVYLFFDWLCQPSTSFPITILGGQSPIMTPYHSLELLKLYPWLSITEESFKYSQKRRGPYKANTLVIPENKIEQILCAVLRDITEGEKTLTEALESNQERLLRLFHSYGYPRAFTR